MLAATPAAALVNLAQAQALVAVFSATLRDVEAMRTYDAAPRGQRSNDSQ